MMEEPSILDYLKSKLMPWKGVRIDIPAEGQPAQTISEPQLQAPAETVISDPTLQPPVEAAIAASAPTVEAASKPAPIKAKTAAAAKNWPWRSLLALILAIAAQASMRPPDRTWRMGVFLLALSIASLIWANLRGELQAAALPESSLECDPPTIRYPFLAAGLVLTVFTYLSFGGLQFKIYNLGVLFLALGFVIAAFWIPARPTGEPKVSWRRKLSNLFSRPQWTVTISVSTIAAFIAIAWVVFFRFYHLGQVPPEMNSDHAEKINDVMRVLSGQTDIFFAANGGREAFQFYLVAGLHQFFNFGLNFTTLKFVTAMVGFLSLPFIYLLGYEVGGRRIGALAFVFAGIAYWPNVVSRVGLRLPFYILFTAATLYFLVRGLRTSRRNDFIFAGIALGLSFYGYQADRILPLLVIVAIGLYLIHPVSTYRRTHVLVSALALILVSFILFVPLMRYIIASPDSFLFRVLTRMSTMERPLPGPAWLIFTQNVGKALAMFSWDDGNVWVISIPGYPALGAVAGGLFYIGLVLVFMRYLRHKSWLDLFLILSIPLLMLPSTLSLAFPDENPNLYRTGGALVPVFLMVGIALDSLMTTLTKRFSAAWGKRLAWGLAIGLILLASLQDYNLVFNEFYKQYLQSAWNTSEMGQVAQGFIDSIGSPDSVWVMGYPYWVDTRLVAINAGYPGRDYEMFVKNDNPAKQLDVTKSVPGAKLFLVNKDDKEAISALTAMYPQGILRTYQSKEGSPDKDFQVFIVPGQANNQ